MFKKWKDSNLVNITLITVCCGVLINGFYLLYIGLIVGYRHHNLHAKYFGIEIFPLIGLTFIYLSFLLNKRKKNAWIFAIVVYLTYLVIVIREKLYVHNQINHTVFLINVALPALILVSLVILRKLFIVKSDYGNIMFSLRVSVIVLLATLIFGVSGFLVLDNTDFHQEITFSGAFHQTIDQFDLTVNKPYVPYTKRAKAFDDTLSVISTLAIFYCLISLFKPLKMKFIDANHNRQVAENLLKKGRVTSEDYFKIWPNDKIYYFNHEKTNCVAYSVHRGVALAVGDPFGAVSGLPNIIEEFKNFCILNDWLPCFIHTEPHFNKPYIKNNFSLQLIGQEAIVNCSKFSDQVITNKYFRNIINRFSKLNYTVEILKPPHSYDVLKRLKQISDEWLTQPNKGERSFLIGYFSYDYLNSCTLVLLKDENNIIQAFLNKLPSYDTDTASYDMIRYSKNSPTNCVDFLLSNFIKYAHAEGFHKVNLGLCPLSGVSDDNENKTALNRTLSFIYANGDRFYSFSGLKKFKDKYEPNWSDRYVAYQGGIPGFLKTMNALNVASRYSKKMPKDS